MRQALNNKQKIQLSSSLGQREYIIDELIGYGASCIVYNAYYLDNFKLRHYVKIKECYPISGAEDHRDQDSIVWKPDAKSEYISRFEQVYKQHVMLQNQYTFVNSTCKVADTLYYGNNTAYLIMESEAGRSFDKAVPGSLFSILKCIKALANTVGKYHEIGFLHLDIKPQNFMVIDETQELIKLFDFDSLVSIDDITSGDIEAISYSNQWAAPEVRQGRINKIRETADVYSIGAVLFFAVFGRNLDETDKLNIGSFSFDGDLFTSINPAIKRELNSFFEKALAVMPSHRHQNMMEVSEDLSKMITLADPSGMFLVSSLPVQNNYFIGREQELSLAASMLSKEKLLITRGMGGIGKTEFAIAFAYRHLADYSCIVFAQAGGNIEDTVMSDSFHIANYDGHDFYGKITALKSVISRNSLIILDNVQEVDKSLLELLELDCKFLITTRASFRGLVDEHKSINLSVLPLVDLINVFRNYYKVEVQDDSVIVDIINAVNGLTLLIPIIAKVMSVNAISPQEMLDKLRLNGIHIDAAGTVRHVHLTEVVDSDVYGHLKTVFSVSNITEDEKIVLRVLSLIDSNEQAKLHLGRKTLAGYCTYRSYDYLIKCIKTGLPSRRPWREYDNELVYYIHRFADVDDLSSINSLIEKGWILFDERADRVFIHDVIRDVMLSELQPDYYNCGTFVPQLLEIANGILMAERGKRDDDYYRDISFETIDYLSDLIVNSISILCRTADMEEKVIYGIALGKIDSVESSERCFEALESIYQECKATADPEEKALLQWAILRKYLRNGSILRLMENGSREQLHYFELMPNYLMNLYRDYCAVSEWRLAINGNEYLICVIDDIYHLYIAYSKNLNINTEEGKIVYEMINHILKTGSPEEIEALNHIDSSIDQLKYDMFGDDIDDAVDLNLDNLPTLQETEVNSNRNISINHDKEESRVAAYNVYEAYLNKVFTTHDSELDFWKILQDILLTNDLVDYYRYGIISEIYDFYDRDIDDTYCVQIKGHVFSDLVYLRFIRNIYANVDICFNRAYEEERAFQYWIATSIINRKFYKLLFYLREYSKLEINKFESDKDKNYRLFSPCRDYVIWEEMENVFSCSGLGVLYYWFLCTMGKAFIKKELILWNATTDFGEDELNLAGIIMDLAQIYNDSNQYYYFLEKRREILAIDMDYDSYGFSSVNNTFEQISDYIDALFGISSESEKEGYLDDLESAAAILPAEVINAFRMAATQPLSLLEIDEFSRKIPGFLLPREDVIKTMEEEEKHTDSLRDKIDVYGELAFQYALLGMNNKLIQYLIKYINLAEQLQPLQLDVIFLQYYSLLPEILGNIDKKDEQIQVYKAMENWVYKNYYSYNRRAHYHVSKFVEPMYSILVEADQEYYRPRREQYLKHQQDCN